MAPMTKRKKRPALVDPFPGHGDSKGKVVILQGFAEETVPVAPTMRATPDALQTLAGLGYSEEEMFALVVPRRTLARRRAGDELLTVEETDKVLRLERIATLAQRVFGDPAKAHRWLRQPKQALGGSTPVEFLASEAGARKVEGMLIRIEHGMFA